MPNFGSLQARLNSAQIKHLADKTLLVGGSNVDGIFNDNYVDPLNVEMSVTSFVCKSSDAGVVSHGTAAIDGATSYIVVGVQPDGLGMVRLILEKQDA